MKKIELKYALSFICLLFIGQGISQIEDAVVSAKEVEAVINSDGTLFFENGQEAGFKVAKFGLPTPKVPTVFAGGIWFGGINSTGDSYYSVSDYMNYHFEPGPYAYEGTIDGEFDFNKVWKVTGEDILALKLDFEDGKIDDTPSEAILSWPGYGNEYLGPLLPAQEFAPFYDQSGDGIYNPNEGDYPIVGHDFPNLVPMQMTYNVYSASNDLHPDGIQVEVHAIMYSLYCSTFELTDRAIFTRHKIINKHMDFDQFFIGSWADLDIGCYIDDHLGSDPERNTYYGYNMDDYDGDENQLCPFGDVSFASNPMVHSARFLNNPMTTFHTTHRFSAAQIPPGAWHPEVKVEFLRTLQGKWRDGTPLTYGGTGYNPGSTDYVNHTLSSDPLDMDGWSMLTPDYPTSDQVVNAVTQAGQFLNEKSITFDMVQLVTMDSDYNHAEKVAVNLAETDEIQEEYDNAFANICDPITQLFDFGVPSSYFKILPNPTKGQVSIIHEGDVQMYSIYNLQGRLMARSELESEQTVINLDLPAGLYSVILSSTSKRYESQKLVIVE